MEEKTEKKKRKSRFKKKKKKRKKKKPSWSQTSIPHLLKVSLGKIICPNPNTVESSIVHSC